MKEKIFFFFAGQAFNMLQKASAHGGQDGDTDGGGEGHLGG